MQAKNTTAALMVGDGLALLAATWIGFLTHAESILSTRWLTTFLPLCLAWALVAPWLGLYRAEILSRPVQAWRAFLAMIIGGPLAAVVRSLMLNTPVLPIFAIVLSGSAGLAMMLWRLAWSWIVTRKKVYG